MKRNKEKGFTIIEVVFATFIAMPMLIIIMRIVPGMLKSIAQSEDLTKITLLAESKIENIRMYAKSNNPLLGFNTDYTEEPTAFSEPFQKYKSQITDTQSENKKLISVSVWKDKNNNNVIDSEESVLNLNTIITKRN
jgi:type II secretory pathway pseudopilin PulG